MKFPEVEFVANLMPSLPGPSEIRKFPGVQRRLHLEAMKFHTQSLI